MSFELNSIIFNVYHYIYNCKNNITIDIYDVTDYKVDIYKIYLFIVYIVSSIKCSKYYIIQNM